MIAVDLVATLAAALRPRKDGRRRIAAAASESRALVGQTLPFTDLPRAQAITDTFHKVGNIVVEMRAP